MTASQIPVDRVPYTYDYRERTFEQSESHFHPSGINSLCKGRLKELGEERGERVTLGDIARWMEAGSDDYVRKLIRGQKPIASRDFVIALCLALEIDSYSADDVLRCVNSAWELDVMVKLDSALADLMDEQRNNHLTLAQVNEALARRGLDALVPIHRKHRCEGGVTTRFPYPLKRKEVKCLPGHEHGDPYQSLETEYHPRKYRVLASAWLEDSQGRRVLELSAEPEGSLGLVTHARGGPFWESFGSPEESGELRPCYAWLREQARSELLKMTGILADTRNYSGRWSARYSDGSVLAFLERYNYSVPEWGEYYLLERVRGEYRLHISNESLFMTRYLRADDYEKYYGTHVPQATDSYGLDDEGDIVPVGESKSPSRTEWRATAFVRMRRELDAHIEELRRGEAKIRDAVAIYGDPYEAIGFFGLSDDLGCACGEGAENLTETPRECAAVDCGEGRVVSISSKEIISGFELGIDSKVEIGLLKLLHGRVDIKDLL